MVNQNINLILFEQIYIKKDTFCSWVIATISLDTEINYHIRDSRCSRARSSLTRWRIPFVFSQFRGSSILQWKIILRVV